MIRLSRQRLTFALVVAELIPLALAAQNLPALLRSAGVPMYDVEIVAEIPHSTESFTQGLVFHAGVLYESTGQYGESLLLRMNAATGEVLKSESLDASLFGEGLALCAGELFQLTWQEKTLLVYDPATFERKRSLSFEGEGWGLTAGEHGLIMSDGGGDLYFRRPDDFALDSTLTVTLASRLVKGLNELEYARGKVYANVLGLDYILEIDLASGVVTAVIDARSLRERVGLELMGSPLNGIAYDSARGEFFLTGKLWPTVFRVRLVRSFGG